MPTDNEIIWEEIDNYFKRAGDNRQANIQLAQPAIERWKGAFVIGLCPGVAEIIERAGSESVRSARLGMSDTMLNLQLFSLTKTAFKQWSDIVSTLGKDAGTTLVADIGVHFDEDEKALDALMLANNFVDTLEPLHREFSKTLLQIMYRDIVGTSCKMAIAWVLYNLDDKKPWEELVFGGHFVKPEHLPHVKMLLKATDPALSDQQIKDMLCKWYAAPYIYPISTLDLLTPIPNRWGILEILALDLASGGRQFSAYPNWQRKSKG